MSASASASRRPLRQSRAISAALRMPALPRREQAPMSASASARVSTSGGSLRDSDARATIRSLLERDDGGGGQDRGDAALTGEVPAAPLHALRRDGLRGPQLAAAPAMRRL